MTLQAVKGQFCFPRTASRALDNPSIGGVLTLDAVDETVAFVVQAAKTGSISQVGWSISNISGASGVTFDIRIETVDLATGFPTGTLWGTNTNGPQAMLATDDLKGWLTPLTASASVTKGDLIAIVFKHPSGTVSTGGPQVFVAERNLFFPTLCANAAASPTVNYVYSALGAPAVYLEYSDGSYAPINGCWPIKDTVTASTFNNSSTPDVRGARFKFPFPVQVTGAWTWLDMDGDFNLKLVSTDYHQGNDTASLRLSLSWDKDVRNLTSPGLALHNFPGTAVLAANTYYRLLVEPSSATGLTFYDFNLNSLAAMDAYAGQDFHLTTAKDPTADGSWTNYNSGTFRVPFIGLILDAFDVGGRPGPNISIGI